ncbi:hypothetical protein BGZ51_008985, partial [Haplosporangium sp. Z 767]
MKFITMLAAICLGGLAAAAPSYGKCGTTASNTFSATSTELTPFPLCLTEPQCLTLNGNLTETIEEGASIQVLGRIQGPPGAYYHTGHFAPGDLCSFLAQTGTPCPVPVGTPQLKVCMTFPVAYPVLQE